MLFIDELLLDGGVNGFVFGDEVEGEMIELSGEKMYGGGVGEYVMNDDVIDAILM